LFDSSCATGSLARCTIQYGPPSSSHLDLDENDSDTGVSSILSLTSKRQAQTSKEKVSKKVKFTVAEGVNKVAEEMRQTRIIKQELATRTTTAIQLLASRYSIELNADQFVKATYHLTDPKNTEIFLALKDMEDSQEMWLKTCINKE
jgi:hypothetical protein